MNVITAGNMIVCFISAGCATADRNVVFQWPEVPFAKGERIVAVSATFKPAQPMCIQRIPAGWNMGTEDAETGGGHFSGSIGVGAAALHSTSKLPIITLRPTLNNAAQIVAEVELQMETYPENTAPDRTVVLCVTNKIPQPSVHGDGKPAPQP